MAKQKIKNRFDGKLRKFWVFIIYFTLIIWCLFSILSIIWIVSTSFRTNRELFANVWGLPTGLSAAIENYNKAWNVVNLKFYLLNSSIVLFTSIFILTFICTPAAYVLSRFNFKGGGLLKNLFIVGMGIPYQVLLIPLYRIFLNINLTDNLFGLILVYTTLSIPFTIFLLSGFLRTLPTELEQAALIDGCSELSAFWRVMFPLAQPGIITAAIFNFIFLWNEYMLALVFIQSDQNRTLPLGLYTIQNAMQYTGDWVGLFAAVVIVMVPSITVFFILSERMITGITLGAVKG